ncbi:hypothetical protein HK405_012455, partial [Cladochytrium tenue]
SRSAAVKRLMKEFADLQRDPSADFTAAPVDDNVFEWHVTVLRGPIPLRATGQRHQTFEIPPNIFFLTPNGRFETNKKICLSITGFHPEYWRPAWGVRSALVALISFMPSEPAGAVAALDYPIAERRRLATASLAWTCPDCGSRNADALSDAPAVGAAGSGPALEDGLRITFAGEPTATANVAQPPADAPDTPAPATTPAPPANPVTSPPPAAQDPTEAGLRARVTPAAEPAAPAAIGAVGEAANHQPHQHHHLQLRRRRIDALILLLAAALAALVARRAYVAISAALLDSDPHSLHYRHP